MPRTYAELNAIARKAWRPSPQSEFIEKWMARAEAAMTATSPLAMMCEIYKSSPALQECLKRALHQDLPTTPPINGEPLNHLLYGAPNGNFNEPVEKPISPQSEFIEDLAAKAAAEKASFITEDEVDAMIENPNITAITVTGSVTWNEPSTPDILSITRDVARSG